MFGQTDMTSATDTLSTSTDWNQINQVIQSLGTALTTYQLAQINLSRAQQGLPPITGAQVAPTVNVGVAPQTLTWLLVGGVALVAVLAMGRKR